MTPVEFHFLTPDGVAVADTEVEIQLSSSTFVDSSGIVMPRTLYAQTNNEGKFILELHPSTAPYAVVVLDRESDAQIYYTFYVPESSETVRLQDLVLAPAPSSTPYDEAAIIAITDAKVATLAAKDASETASTAAGASQVAAQSHANTAATAKDNAEIARDASQAQAVTATTAVTQAQALILQAQQVVAEATNAVQVLRNELANATDPEKGASLLWFKHGATGAVARSAAQRFAASLDLMDFGAAGNGIADDSNALEAFWQYIRNTQVNYDPSSLSWTTIKYVIPPGVYRVTRSINWTNLFAWNVFIEAEGALIIAEVNGKSVIDMCSCRGVHLNGLAIQTASGYLPKSAILLGPKLEETSGNNRFSNVKTAGTFSIAACHNIGCETTLYNHCYWQNNNNTGYAYAADCSHWLGAVSDYVELRAPNNPVSFTSNGFQGCRFANYAPNGNAVYTESTNGWWFDKTCYWLSFDKASLVIRESGLVRTISLKVAGLFETTQGAGLKHVVKIIMDNGVISAIDGFELDAASPHASVSVVRLEDPNGNELTSGSMSLRSAIIKVDTAWVGTLKLFSGAKLSYSGHLNVRPSEIIDISGLEKMHGTICTRDSNEIVKASGSVQHAYIVNDDISLSGQGVLIGGSAGGFIGFQGGTVPRIRAEGPNSDADLWLSGKGAGYTRFGTFTNDAGGGYITVKSEEGVVRKLRCVQD